MPFVKLVKNKQYFKRYQVKFRRRREGKTDYRARRKMITPDKTKYNMPKYRLVVRFSNKYVTVQCVYSEIVGDKVVCQATSRELEKYGLEVGLKNFSAAYCTGFLCARRCLQKFGLDEIYTGAVEEDDDGEEELDITGEVVSCKQGKRTYYVSDYDLEHAEGGRKPFKAILDTGAITTTTGHRVFAALKGATDGGMDIPHNQKRFAGYDRDDKEFDPEQMKDRILGQHVVDYMEYLLEEDETKYKTQFAKFIERDIGPEEYMEVIEDVLTKIREDPSAAEKKSFTPDKSFKRAGKTTLAERKAKVIAKKVAMMQEDSEDDE
jgi:large subunit ribosomal protein L5e